MYATNSGNSNVLSHEMGLRSYELSNHLGNVLSVISDKVIPHPSGSTVAYYKADIQQAMDYSPFGVTLKGRNLKKTGLADEFRYGFNGMEADDEMKGEGNSYTTHFRMLDPRLGRWLSIDPKSYAYPNESPYLAFHNNPIYYTDPFGDDPPESLIQKVAREIVKSARFSGPIDHYHDYRNGALDVTEVGIYGVISYRGNEKPSKVFRSVLKKVSSGEIGIDCQFSTVLIYTATVLEMMGDKKFDKMFKQTSEDKKRSGSNAKYDMLASTKGLSRGLADIGMDRSDFQTFESDNIEGGAEAANNAEVGSIIQLTAINPSLVTNKNHINEVMIKVGADAYVAFNYTEGVDAKFYTLSEILEETKAAGSEFRVQGVIKLNYGDEEKK